MEQTEVTWRFRHLSPDKQIRVLAAFGHSLTIAARDTYEFQAPGVRAPERLRDVNEIQHLVFAHILALTIPDARRYPDDVLVSIALEHGDEHLQAQALSALEDAVNREAA